MKKNRVIALLLAVVMLFSTVTVAGTAFITVGAADTYVFPIKNGISKITSYYGYRWGTLHGGLDIGVPIGTEVFAAYSGVVTAVANQCWHVSTGAKCEHWKTYGNYVRIQNDNGTTAYYGHIAPDGIRVSVGTRVSAGQVIALSGSSGYSTGPHLHFELRDSAGNKINTNPGSISYTDAYVPDVTFENIAEGTYRFINKGSGKYLNAFANPGQAVADKTEIRACNGDGTAEQNFRVQSVGDRKYYIRSLSNSNEYCVNAVSGSTVKDGAKVHLYYYNDVPSKFWQFRRDGDYYIIYNVMNPGLVITAENADHRAHVIMKPYTGSDLQKWKIDGLQTASRPIAATASANKTRVQVGSNINFSFSAENATGYTIGIDRNNKRIVTQSVNADFSYKCDQPGFYSAYVSASNAAGFVDSNRVNWVVYDNGDSDFYAYIIKKDTWKHIDNLSNNVQLSQNGNQPTDPKQIWHFVKQSDDSYKIINEYNGRALDVDNAGTADNTNVSTYIEHGDKNQRWYLCSFDGATYIVSSYVDKVLDVTSNSNNLGANIAIFGYNGSSAQQFSVYDLKKDGVTYSKPAKPDKPTVTVSPVENSQETMIEWTASPEKGEFDKRTYAVTVYSSGVKCFELTTGSLRARAALAEGNYTVEVAAVNSNYENYSTKSNLVSFSVGTCIHSWNGGAETKASDCTEDGVMTYTCALCGTAKTEAIPAKGHEWEKTWTFDKAATKTETGEKSHHCIRCSERTDITVVDKISDDDPVSLITEAECVGGTFMNIAWTVQKNAGQSIESMDLRVWRSDEDRPTEPGHVREAWALAGEEQSTTHGSAFLVGAGGDIDMEIAYNTEYSYEVNAVVDGKNYVSTGSFSVENEYAEFSLDTTYAPAAGASSDTVSVNVYLNNNPGIAGISMALDYDKEALEVVGLTKGDIFDSVSDSADKNILLDNPRNTTETGLLFSVEMKLKDPNRKDDLNVGINVKSCVSITGSGASTSVDDVSFLANLAVPLYFANEVAALPQQAINKLATEVLSGEAELMQSPAAFELKQHEDGSLTQSEDISGIYTIKETDLDGDGENELVAFSLVSGRQSSTNYPLQQLQITVYDKNEDGYITAEDYSPYRFDSAAIYEFEGSNRYFAAVDGNKIVLLRYFSYDSCDFDYTVLSYKNGSFNVEASYEIYARGFDEENKCTIRDKLSDSESTRVTIGSDEAVKTVADIKKSLGSLVSEYLLFPLDENGDVFDVSAMSDDAFLEMYTDYNADTNTKSFHVVDKTFTYEIYGDSTPSYEPQPEIQYGDVNDDGVSDAADAGLISRSDAGFIILTADQLKTGDVNKDGVVDAADAGLISRYDAGFISTLG